MSEFSLGISHISSKLYKAKSVFFLPLKIVAVFFEKIARRGAGGGAPRPQQF